MEENPEIGDQIEFYDKIWYVGKPSLQTTSSNRDSIIKDGPTKP